MPRSPYPRRRGRLAAPRAAFAPALLSAFATFTALLTGSVSAQITPSRSVLVGAAGDRPARTATLVLSDLAPVFTEGSLGPVERNQSVGGLGALDGTPIVIGGQSFATGFGTRAPSVIAYDLGARAQRFTVWVGIDDAAPAGGSARFQVLGDGALLFDSGLRRDTDAALFSGSINVRGVRELLLVVQDGDDGFASDHADWAQPTLISTARNPVRDGRALRRVRGDWGPVLPWPVQPIHATLLPSGEILSHASVATQGGGSPAPGAAHDSTRVDLSDAATFTHVTVDHPTEELYGAGHARLSDGTLLAVGGFAGRVGGGASAAPLGQGQASQFSLSEDEWIPVQRMNAARWGASALTLGDGSVLALGGTSGGGALAPEVLLDGAWRALTGVSLSSYLSVGDAPLDRTYPGAHVAPDGQVFWAGWGERMGLIEAREGVGRWTFEGLREPTQRAWGTSTQVRPDYVLLAGGVNHQGNPGVAARTAIRCNLGGSTPTVQSVSSMLFRRADHNATILADGRVLVTGGNVRHADGVSPSPWRVPETFDPVTGTWSLAAPARRARGFRSSALLLPDGRVWTGGGQDPLSAQVYTPSYLYASDESGDLAARPSIQSAPQQVAYSETFEVAVAALGSISRVTFVRLGSSTHGTNSDQRFLELEFTQSGNALSVTAPDRGHEAPPGHYMLFAFDGAGVPSTARIVRIGPPRPSAWQLVSTFDGSAPVERHEAAAVTVGGKFYLLGGRGQRVTQVYDPVDASWRFVGLPPFELNHFQPVVLDGLVYVVGAFTGPYPNEQNVTQVLTWDPIADVWQTVGSVPAARARGSAGTVVYDGKIYLVGGNNQGHNGGARPWFDCYDPQTNTWTVLPDAPRARDHFLASVVGNRLVLAGGRATDLPNPFDKTIAEVDVYDFTAGTWKTLAADIPTQRAGTMTVPVGRHVVVVGGESDPMVASHDEAEALDVLAERWTALPDLITGRHSGGVGILDGRIFVASGSGNRGGAPELPTAEFIAGSDLLADDPLNLIDNGGFSAGLRSWSTAGDAALVASGGAEAPGLRLRAATALQSVAGQAGNDYAGRMFYTLSGGGAALFRVDYLSAAGTVIGQAQTALVPSTALRIAEVLFTAPAGTVTLRIVATISGPAELIIDDLTIADR